MYIISAQLIHCGKSHPVAREYTATVNAIQNWIYIKNWYNKVTHIKTAVHIHIKKSHVSLTTRTILLSWVSACLLYHNKFLQVLMLEHASYYKNKWISHTLIQTYFFYVNIIFAYLDFVRIKFSYAPYGLLHTFQN